MKKILAWIEQKLTDSSAFVKPIEKSIEDAAETKILDLLQQLHDHNIDDYKAAIEAGNTFIQHLLPFAEKSELTLADAILADIATVISESAVNNKITL